MAALWSARRTVLAALLLVVLVASAYDLDENELPTRAPGEVPTLLRDHHSREVAACRRRGNLYAYYAPMGHCMPLMETVGSPCPQPEVLVLNASTLEAQCMRLPCDVTHVLLPDGGCHTKEEFCDHADDKELVLKETGYGTCDCPDLHVYWMEDDRCYPAYTRGPCADGEYIVFREQVGVLCERNPCPEEQVPWRGQCVPRTGHGCLDSKHGHLVLNPANLKYECTLRCPEGMVEVELDCYDLYTRGPCPAGQYVVHVHGSQQGRCEENPCGEDDLVPWDDRCWQRGQYCAADLPPPAPSSALSSASEERRPQKREPVLLPDDDHLFILDRDDLVSSGPADGWVDSGPTDQFGLFGSSGGFSGFSSSSELSGSSGFSGKSEPSGSSAPSSPSGPSIAQPGAPRPTSVPKQMLPPPPEVPPGPAPPMRLGGSSDTSHLIQLPSPHFGVSLEQIAAFNSILPPLQLGPGRLGQFGQPIAQNLAISEPPPAQPDQSSGVPPQGPSILPAPAHMFQQPDERAPAGPSAVPPSAQFPPLEMFGPPPSPAPAETPRAPSSGGSVPFLAHGYLPPPPSGGGVLAKRHTESTPFPSFQMDFAAMRPFGWSPGFSGHARLRRSTPSRHTRPRRSARQDANTRFAELRDSNGFVSVDDDHPFNGNFDTLSAVQGLHINVNPLTYEVECSDAIGYYRTISFAHYKCRPGSRRDLLGECHHEGPDWTDFHPDRCPFGRRHNLLTGKCMRIS